MAKRVRLIIARHTLTDDNVENRYSGQNYIWLNQIGETQRDELASELALLHGICAIVGSDLPRTSEVAECLGRRLGLNPILTPLLREVDVGKMTDLLKSEAVETYPGDHHHVSLPTFDFSDIGGESHVSVIKRYELALAFLVNEFGVEDEVDRALPRVVLVGHGTAFNLVFKHTHHIVEYLHNQGAFQEFVWPTC